MKIFLTIMIIICLLLFAAFIYLVIYTLKRDKKYSSKEQLMPGKDDRSALIIYQPSAHNGNVSISNSIAVALNEKGYSVTINRPSDTLYNLENYDVIAFGSGVYMGNVAKPILNYIKNNNTYTGKKVFIYLTGADLENSSEINSVSSLIPEGNDIHSIKLQKNEIDKITDFIKINL